MSDTLSPELQEYIDLYAAAKTEVQEIVDGLSDEQLNWCASEKSWSILECIEHLYKVGDEMMGPIQREIESGRAAGKTGSGPFKYGFLGTKFVNGAGPITDTNKFKGKSPKLYAPATGSNLTRDELIPKFLQLQDDLADLTRSADGLDLRRIKVTSPALAIIRLNLGLWLRMLPGHQLRHFQQARRVRDQLPRA